MNTLVALNLCLWIVACVATYTLDSRVLISLFAQVTQRKYLLATFIGQYIGTSTLLICSFFVSSLLFKILGERPNPFIIAIVGGILPISSGVKKLIENRRSTEDVERKIIRICASCDSFFNSKTIFARLHFKGSELVKVIIASGSRSIAVCIITLANGLGSLLVYVSLFIFSTLIVFGYSKSLFESYFSVEIWAYSFVFFFIIFPGFLYYAIYLQRFKFSHLPQKSSSVIAASTVLILLGVLIAWFDLILSSFLLHGRGG